MGCRYDKTNRDCSKTDYPSRRIQFAREEGVEIAIVLAVIIGVCILGCLTRYICYKFRPRQHRALPPTVGLEEDEEIGIRLS
jgi:hypothetical protein